MNFDFHILKGECWSNIVDIEILTLRHALYLSEALHRGIACGKIGSGGEFSERMQKIVHFSVKIVHLLQKWQI